MRRPPRRLAAATALAAVTLSSAAAAHQADASFLTFAVQDGRVSGALRLDPVTTAQVYATARGLAGKPSANEYARDRNDDLRGYLVDQLAPTVDGSRCSGLSNGRLVYERANDLLLLEAEWACGSTDESFRFAYPLFGDDPAHSAIVTLQAGGQRERFVLTPTRRRLDRALPEVGSRTPWWGSAPAPSRASPAGTSSAAPASTPVKRAPAATTTPPTGFRHWFGTGFFHVLGGWDHLAFLGALVLALRDHRRLALATVSFTVAHSITLALVALDVVQLPARLVETAIAASIGVAAALSLRTPAWRAPWWSVAGGCFAIGLVHGLGFGGFLRSGGLTGGDAAAIVLPFNLGIEAGQLLLVVPVAAALSRLGDDQRRPVTRVAAVALIVISVLAAGARVAGW